MKYEKSNYGEVEFEGREYRLTSEADFTSRLLPGPWNLKDVEDGEEYQFEMSADAIDDQGKGCKVIWIFWKVKGEDGWELDSLDYDKVQCVREV
jgi:hypothetical protein